MAAGAKSNVLRAMGLDSLRIEHMAAETAGCPLCHATLNFFTDSIGRTLEQCSNRSCENAEPHTPQPTHFA
jgi:hypothetical protein